VLIVFRYVDLVIRSGVDARINVVPVVFRALRAEAAAAAAPECYPGPVFADLNAAGPDGIEACQKLGGASRAQPGALLHIHAIAIKWVIVPLCEHGFRC
jgi:hypothetical protein